MKTTRRALLQAGAVGAVATFPQIARLWSDARLDLIVFDSRFPASVPLAQGMGSATLDVAPEYENLWRNLRAAKPSGRVAGVTRWEEFIIVRNWFEDQGKRVKSERLLPNGSLIKWEIG